MSGQYAELVKRANAYVGNQAFTNGEHLIVDLASALATLTQQQKQHGDLALPIVNGGASTTASGTHTLEPWRLFNKNKTLAIEDGHGHEHENAVVAWPGFDSGDKPWRTKVANARRIVACVNACAGASTADLEDGTAVVIVKNKVDGTAQETSTRSADE